MRSPAFLIREDIFGDRGLYLYRRYDKHEVQTEKDVMQRVLA